VQRVRTTVLAVVLMFACSFVACSSDEGDVTICTAEAMLGPNGESYGRSGEHDCRFVDDDGKPLTTNGAGGPLCYDEAMLVVPCG
jgi:hypothetical protein